MVFFASIASMLETYSMAADPASTAEEAAFFAATPTASITGPEYSIVASAIATAASATSALFGVGFNALKHNFLLSIRVP